MSIGKTGQTILLADIGGTNARFALTRDDQIGPIDYVKVADHPTVREAITDGQSKGIFRREMSDKIAAN